jgi:hypothetical protein
VSSIAIVVAQTLRRAHHAPELPGLGIAQLGGIEREAFAETVVQVGHDRQVARLGDPATDAAQLVAQAKGIHVHDDDGERPAFVRVRDERRHRTVVRLDAPIRSGHLGSPLSQEVPRCRAAREVPR